MRGSRRVAMKGYSTLAGLWPCICGVTRSEGYSIACGIGSGCRKEEGGSTVFEAAALLLGIVAGAIAALSGFGIGSVLTPLFSTQLPVKLAVAAVSVPHFAATAFRLYLMRAHIHRRVLLSFGLMSAV